MIWDGMAKSLGDQRILREKRMHSTKVKERIGLLSSKRGTRW
jgi:hypothetical protein